MNIFLYKNIKIINHELRRKLLVECDWSINSFQKEVKEGRAVDWETRKIMFSNNKPAAGDIIIFFYVKSKTFTPGICGIGIITKYLPRRRRIYFVPIPPTNQLKKQPWFDEQVEDYLDLIRHNAVRGTMYRLPAIIESEIRRGMFIRVNKKRATKSINK
jgi:hypothetical protein